LAAASLAFFQSAFAVMPQHTKAMQPNYDSIVKRVNKLLQHKYDKPLPGVQTSTLTVKDVK
jgi:hypothetical protein